jgi:hypothetical protein
MGAAGVGGTFGMSAGGTSDEPGDGETVRCAGGGVNCCGGGPTGCKSTCAKADAGIWINESAATVSTITVSAIAHGLVPEDLSTLLVTLLPDHDPCFFG